MTSQSSQEATWPTPYTVEPLSSPHTQTFILFHGLGSNGDNFGRDLLHTGISSNGHSLRTAFPSAKFIFPTAKIRRVTALKRSRVRAWIDTYSLEDRLLREDVQIEGLEESSEYLRAIIDRELEDGSLQPENIVLGGISNGCAMGLIALLTLNFSVGAFIGLCARLPFGRDIDEIIRQVDAATDQDGDDPFAFGDDGDDENVTEKKDTPTQVLDFVRDLLSLDATVADKPASSGKGPLSTPVFLGHGDSDHVVEHTLGEGAAQTLSSIGVDVTWKLYPGLGHWYEVPREIDDIFTFLSDKTQSFRLEKSV